MNVVLIGLGHSLRGDDAAGLEAVRTWQRSYPDTASQAGLRAELLESGGLELANALEGAEALLLVDAVCSGNLPGTLHRLMECDIDNAGITSGSAHGWGIPEALRLAGAMGLLPLKRSVRLLGIEAEQMNLGASLSTAVEQSIPGAADAIEEEIQTFLRK